MVYYETKYPKDNRLRKAIGVTKKYLRDKTTVVTNAHAAAHAAALAAAKAADTDAHAAFAAGNITEAGALGVAHAAAGAAVVAIASPTAGLDANAAALAADAAFYAASHATKATTIDFGLLADRAVKMVMSKK